MYIACRSCAPSFDRRRNQERSDNVPSHHHISAAPCTGFKRSFRLGRLLPIVLLLAGCAVQPEPLTQLEVKRRVQTDLGRMFLNQEPVTARIGLFEAMARAVRYNLTQRVKRMEAAVAGGNLDLAQRDLLPQLAASAGYAVRDNDPNATRDGAPTPVTALERGQGAADLTVAWNVLDFGVSYVQAQQQADRTLIAAEQRRKSTQNILQEVRAAYWRAATADLLLPSMDQLLAEMRPVLASTRELEKSDIQTALAFQQTLLETTRRIWSLRRELTGAKNGLAALINLPPGSEFRLQTVPEEMIDADLTGLPPSALENYALLHRPELREADYQERIDAREVRKILLGALPGLNLGGALNHDGNRYLLNQAWASAGLQLSWNLFNWVSTPRAVAAARARTDLTRTRRLAFSMAVLTQLQLALQSYHLSHRDLAIAQELNRVHDRQMLHARHDGEAGEREMDEIRSRSEALVARMDQGLAFADLQVALGRIHLTLGLDPLPLAESIDQADLGDMARILASRQAAAAVAVISEIPGEAVVVDALPPGVDPATHVPDRLIFPETDGASLEKDGSARFWGTLERFSNTLSPHQAAPVGVPVAALPASSALPAFPSARETVYPGVAAAAPEVGLEGPESEQPLEPPPEPEPVMEGEGFSLSSD